MNDHNLDDLIIDTIAPQHNKTKSLLTFIALLIIVLIIGIVLTKTLLKTPEHNELVSEDNMSETIVPELTLQKNTENDKANDKLSIYTIIKNKVTEVKVPKKLQQDTKPVSLKKDETTKEKEKEKKEPSKTEQKKVNKVKVEKAKVEKAKPAIELPQTQERTKIEKQKVTKTVKESKVKEVKATVKKPIAKPQNTKDTKYYIQVGSFKQNPSHRFLMVIKNSGFNYQVTSPNRSGYKRLLIGAYNTRIEANIACSVIKERIHKSAFVTQK